MDKLKDTLTPLAIALDQIPRGRNFGELAEDLVGELLNCLDRAMHALDSDEHRTLALSKAKMHPVWQVRCRALAAARNWYPLPAAESVILDLTHDSVDVVAFQAIRLCGDLRLRTAIPHLTRISGWPSRFTQENYLRKPVGIGAALTKFALFQIFGSQNSEDLARMESEFVEPFRRMVAKFQPEPDLTRMVRIPAGPFVLGSQERDDFRFEYQDYIPTQTVHLPEFFIDAKPVTNLEYREFASAVERNEHLHCHPDEPLQKDHWPAHIRDPRFGGDQIPVTGIDWYDAYAYASFRGKQLPTEVQWEKAARGTDGREYPWGNDWRPGIVNYVEQSFCQKVENLSQWEEILREVSPEKPARPVWEVGMHEAANSPYGVSDMAGNIWEWTRTNFYSKDDMDPFFKGRDVLDFTNRVCAFPVIRGGCWTSLPEMLRTFFRGKDLLTDRHFEIGFRCVVEIAS